MTFEEFRDKWGSVIHDKPEMIWEAGFFEAKRQAVEAVAIVHGNSVAREIAPFTTCHCGDSLRAIGELKP